MERTSFSNLSPDMLREISRTMDWQTLHNYCQTLYPMQRVQNICSDLWKERLAKIQEETQTKERFYKDDFHEFLRLRSLQLWRNIDMARVFGENVKPMEQERREISQILADFLLAAYPHEFKIQAIQLTPEDLEILKTFESVSWKSKVSSKRSSIPAIPYFEQFIREHDIGSNTLVLGLDGPTIRFSLDVLGTGKRSLQLLKYSSYNLNRYIPLSTELAIYLDQLGVEKDKNRLFKLKPNQQFRRVDDHEQY